MLKQILPSSIKKRMEIIGENMHFDTGCLNLLFSPLQFTQWVDAVIFVFSMDDELSFSVLSGYYAKLAQYRKYISDIPVILVAINGEQNELLSSSKFI